MKKIVAVVLLVASSAFGACGGGGWKKPAPVAEAAPVEPPASEPKAVVVAREEPKTAEAREESKVESQTEEPRKEPRPAVVEVVAVQQEHGGIWQSPFLWAGALIFAMVVLELYLRSKHARLPDESSTKRPDVQDPEQGHQA